VLLSKSVAPQRRRKDIKSHEYLLLCASAPEALKLNKINLSPAKSTTDDGDKRIRLCNFRVFTSVQEIINP